MIIVKPSFEIVSTVIGREILSRIEEAGRTCYKSEDRITFDSSMRFVESIIKRGHESVIEHESVSVRVVCDRGISHEWVRHRIGSVSQESTRYCDYAGGVTFIRPPWLNLEELPLNNELGDLVTEYLENSYTGEVAHAERIWLKAVRDSEMYYTELLECGWTPQKARSVLPNSLKTEFVFTANLRSWRNFFNLRTTKAAHPQMREIAVPLLKEFQRLIPVIFNDITPYVGKM